MFQKGMCMIASSRWLMVVSRLAKGSSKIQESLRRLLWPCQKWLWNANVHHPRHIPVTAKARAPALSLHEQPLPKELTPSGHLHRLKTSWEYKRDVRQILKFVNEYHCNDKFNGMTMNDRHCVEAKPPWFYRSSWCPSGWQDLCYITFQFWLAWPRKNEEQ